MAEPAIQRPDGTLYRPRKLSVYPVSDEDEIITGAVVFGTHEPARVLGLAQQLVDRHLGRGQFLPVDPVRVWWRDGFESGHRCWVTDEKRGRAGVLFREIVEPAPADLLGEEERDGR